MKKKVAITLSVALGMGLMTPSGMVQAAEPNVGEVVIADEGIASDTDAIIDEVSETEEVDEEKLDASDKLYSLSGPIMADLYSDGRLVIRGDYSRLSGGYIPNLKTLNDSLDERKLRSSVKSVDIDIPFAVNCENAFKGFGAVTEVKMSIPKAVQSSAYMFSGCVNLDTIDLSGFGNQSVTDMSYMFAGCRSFKTIDLSGAVNSKTTDISYMFSGCQNLESVWFTNCDLSNVRKANGLFYGSGMKSIDFNNYSMILDEAKEMFANCKNLTTIDYSGLNTASVTDMSGMFSGCTGMESICLTGLDTRSVTNADNMFSGCVMKSIDLSNNYMPLESSEAMFKKCENLESVNLGSINNENNTNMKEMFASCSNLKDIVWDKNNTKSLVNMEAMFANCTSIEKIDLSGFDTSNVTTMLNLFAHCKNLEELDLSNFNTSNVTNMNCMFAQCGKIKKLDLSNFNTSKVQYMSSMFDTLTNIEYLDVSSFDTSNVTDMRGMFMWGGEKLHFLDLSSFKFNLEQNFAGNMLFANHVDEVKVPAGINIHIMSPAGYYYRPDTGESIRYTWLPTNLEEPMIVKNTTINGSIKLYGNLQYGSKLTNAYTDLNNIDSDLGYIYQWTRDGVIIDGASGYYYTIKAEDIGHKLGCIVSCGSLVGTVEYQSDKVVSALAAPVLNKPYVIGNAVNVSWNAMVNADKYRVYRKENGGKWKKISDIAATSFADNNVVDGIKYTYTVACLDESGNVISEYDKTGRDITFTSSSVEGEVSHGTFGTDFSWEYNHSTKKLTVSGSGDFPEKVVAPWNEFKDEIEIIEIKDGITSIGRIFEEYDTVKKVILADTVSNFQFYECHSLEDVNIPKAATSIDGSFIGCESLKSIYIPDTVNDISYAFRGCISLDNVTVPSSVTNVEYAFTECTSLKNVSIPEGIKSMKNTFENCTSLTYVSLPTSVTCIDECYKGCTGLVDVVIPSNITKMKFAFVDCSNIKSVKLEPSDDFVNIEGAFQNCVNLELVDIQRNIHECIGAFGDCKDLKKVKLPESFLFVSCDSMFYNCNIGEINIPINTNFISDRVAVDSFWNCTIDRLYLPAGVGFFDSSISKMNVNELIWNVSYEYVEEMIPYWEEFNAANNKKWFGGKIKLTGTSPAMSDISNGEEGIDIAWEPVSNLTSYKVYRKTDKTDWTVIGDVEGTSYTDKSVTKGVKYYYAVSATGTLADVPFETSYSVDCLSITSAKSFGVQALETPELKSAANTTAGVKVTWNSVTGTEKYRIYRKQAGGSWSSIATVAAKDGSTTASYEDKTALSGETYLYTVRCISADGKTYQSAYDKKGIEIKFVASPVISGLTNTVNGIKVTWKAVAGAEQYVVFRKNDAGKWTKLGLTTSTSYEDNGVTSGKAYIYTVRCINADGKTYSSSYDSNGKENMYVAAPTLSSVSNTTKGVKLTWKKVAGATNYRVYRKNDGGKWQYVIDTTGTSYEDIKVASGTTYTYTVKCISEDGAKTLSAYDTTGLTIRYLSAPVVNSVAKSTKGIKITWNEVEGAAKYRVYKKTEDGSWKKLKDTTSLSCTDTAVEAGTTYTYTVRCISSDGTAFESAYDTVGKSLKYR